MGERAQPRQASRSLATALFGCALARGLLAEVAAGVVVPQFDGVKATESGKPAPNINEGRPCSTMQESTCHWNARACVLSTPPARSFGKARPGATPSL